MILYSDELSFMERNFVIAHEIAHVILGHSTVGHILGKSKDSVIESEQEFEADAFASYLLAPASILLKSGILSSNSIRAATAISDNYLLGKADEIAHLRETNLSPSENRLCKQFKSYILRQRLQKYRKYGFSLIICAGIVSVIGMGLYSSLKPTEYHTPTTVNESLPDAEEIPVFITPTGDKFHRETCSSIKHSDLTETTIADAIKTGYGACKICRPLNFEN